MQRYEYNSYNIWINNLSYGIKEKRIELVIKLGLTGNIAAQTYILLFLRLLCMER